MLNKLGLCTYKNTGENNFMKNITLSGSIGFGAMIGRNYIITKINNYPYVITKATIEDIKNIELGAKMIEFLLEQRP